MSVEDPNQEAEVRHQALSPASPKPLQIPSPSNIPILAKQMDPDFQDSLSQEPPSSSSVDQSAPLAISEADSVNGNSAAPPAEPMTGVESAAPVLPEADAVAAAESGSEAHVEDPPLPVQAVQEPTLLTETGEPIPQNLGSIATESEQPVSADGSAATSLADGHGEEIIQSAVENGVQPVSQVATSNPAVNPANIVDFQTLLDNLAQVTPSLPSGTLNSEMIEPSRDPAVSVTNPDPSVSSTANGSGLPAKPPVPDAGANGSVASNLPTPVQGQFGNKAASSMPPGVPAGSWSSNPAFGHIAPPPGITIPSNSSSTLPTSFPPNAPTGWNLEKEAQFQAFLTYEKKNETDRNWNRFPLGSRLFVGNLSTEDVDKRDVFNLFSKYGQLAQISVKRAYGFVQFEDAAVARKVLESEQGAALRGRTIHLEISKPQSDKNNTDSNRNNNNNNNNRRRSRSRSRSPGRRGSDRAPKNVDRYVSGSGRGSSPSRGDRDRHYRPGGRSPSPRGHRDNRRYDRSPPRYDGRRRSRSPDRRHRNRSPTPSRYESRGQPIMPRAYGSVDVQILVLDQADHLYVSSVEQILRSTGLRCDTTYLDRQQMSGLDGLVLQLAQDGVTGVIQLSQYSIQTGCALTIFERVGGPGNVNVVRYDNLQPNIVATLVLSKRVPPPATQAPIPSNNMPYGQQPYGQMPAAPQYGYQQSVPQTGYGQPQHQQPQIPPNANISNLLSNLQSPVGGSMPPYPSAIPQQGRPASAHNSGNNAYGNRYGHQQQQQQQQQQQGYQVPQGYQPHHHQRQASASSAWSQQNVQPPTPQSATSQTPDMSEIMAQLAKYNR